MTIRSYNDAVKAFNVRGPVRSLAWGNNERPLDRLYKHKKIIQHDGHFDIVFHRTVMVKFKSFQDRDAYIALQLAKNEEEITGAINECECEYESEPLLTFATEDIKWYESFSDIRAHTSIYKDAHKLFNASYRFFAPVS